MDTLIQDIRYAFRMLARTPGFTAIAVLALALGIGVNTVIFSVVNAVVLRPLPYPQPGQLVTVFHSYPKLNLPRASVSPYGYLYYHDHLSSFESLAAFTDFRTPQNLTGKGDPERVNTIMVSAHFFRALGVSPRLGRTFLPEEDQPGKNREVVLSYGLWKQRYGSDNGILGKSIGLDGQNYEVIGVMPEGFQMPSEASLWTPIAFTPQETNEQTEYLYVFGRLKPGVSVQQADAEMSRLSAEIVHEIPELAAYGFHVGGIPLSQLSQEGLRTQLLLLLFIVGLVLLIACANVANLLLSRAAARQREIALRAALGASRRRIIRQLLTESMLLALIGGAAGLFIAYQGLGALLAYASIKLPGMFHVNIDGYVLFFTFALAMLTGLLFGLAPALHVSGKQLNESLSQGGRTLVSRGRERLRQGLMGFEVAIAIMLLVVAGLVMRTFLHVTHANPGFDASNTLTARIALQKDNYPAPEKISIFQQQLLQRISALPEVKNAAIASSVPLVGGWTRSFMIEGKLLKPDPHTFFATVTPQYFGTLGIPLISGRSFSESDTATAPLVAIVDEKAAHTYFPGESPIGKRINLNRNAPQAEWREIVGVVGGVQHRSPLMEESKGGVYVPFVQMPQDEMVIAVRSTSSPAALASAIRHEVAQLDRGQAIFEIKTMEMMLNEFVAEPRFNLVLVGLFAGLALVLSSIGIYGVISYSVTQRIPEIGIRMALGASKQNVLQMVLAQTLKVTVMGVIAGIAVALLVTRLFSSMLFGVSNYDPLTFMCIVALMIVVAALAGYVPARRAARVDPLVALRCE